MNPIDKLKASWAKTSKRSKIFFGATLGILAIVAVLSLGGMDFTPPV